MKQYETDKLLVDYFELGCLCLITGKINKSTHKDVKVKAKYYMDNCTCSRHPECFKRFCWDREEKTKAKSKTK